MGEVDKGTPPPGARAFLSAFRTTSSNEREISEQINRNSIHLPQLAPPARRGLFQMKHTAIALTFATLLLAGTPALAENPAEAPFPGSDSAPPAAPYDANAAPIVVVPVPEPRKTLAL